MNAFRLVLPLLSLLVLSASSFSDPAPKTGATYYVVPLRGVVGRQITAAVVREALDDARTAKPDVVVLEIESAGGHIAETDDIVKVLSEAKDLHLVAYVKNALGAATPLALACKQIYVVPSTTIGGPFSFGGAPTPGGKIDPKYITIWRAQCRNAAEMGAHSPLIAEGIADPDVELSIVDKDGVPTVVKGPEGKPLKKAGAPLTLSGKDCVASGLAFGEMGSYAELGTALGFTGWQSAGTKGQQIMTHWSAEVAKTEAELMKKAGGARVRVALWSNYIAAKPQIDKADQAIDATQTDGRNTDQELARLKTQYDADRSNIQHTYSDDIAAAKDDARLKAEASRRRSAAFTALDARYAPQIKTLNDRNATLVRQYAQQCADRKKLILSLELP